MRRDDASGGLAAAAREAVVRAFAAVFGFGAVERRERLP
jgi:hypothetical protein